jgi:carbamoylphosphate synthase large subunit
MTSRAPTTRGEARQGQARWFPYIIHTSYGRGGLLQGVREDMKMLDRAIRRLAASAFSSVLLFGVLWSIKDV